MQKLLKLILVVFMMFASLSITKSGNIVEAVEVSPNGNYLTFSAVWDTGCKELIDLSGAYSIAGIEYTVTNDGTKTVVGTFVTDKNGKGINKATGTSFIDNLPDGTYSIKMTKTVTGVIFDGTVMRADLKSTKKIPTSVDVTTVCDMYLRNSNGDRIANNQYKLWTTSYGTGAFECANAMVDAPSQIRQYGTHTISLNDSNCSVLERNGNAGVELMYKALYYGRSGIAEWSGFSNPKSNALPFTTRDGSTYYGNRQTEIESWKASVTHLALDRAANMAGYASGEKWKLTSSAYGFNDFWNFIYNAPRVPDDFVVTVWWNLNSYGTQNMCFGYKMETADFDHKEITASITTEFDPVAVILTKSGTDSERIADAEFTMKYYREDFSTVSDASKYSAVKSWIFKTDADGVLLCSNAYKVSGDEILVDEFGQEILIPGTYTVEETKVPAGYTKADTFLIKASADLNVMPVYLDKNGNPIPRTIEAGYSLTELKEGYATLNKKPAKATSNSVAGAEYTVYTDSECTTVAKINNSNDDAILVTKADGTTQTIALAPATYYVKETKTPSQAFKLDPTVHKINIAEEQTVVVESTEEVRDIVISVIKKDSIGEPVANVVFGVYNAKNEEIATITTDADGKGTATITYDVGLYLKEKACPYGYKLNNSKFPVTNETLNNNGALEIEPIEVTDDLELIKVKVIKVDADNNEIKLDGAAFEIRDTDGNVISKGVTENGGTCTFSIQFRPEYNGKLVLVETAAPFGYKLGDVTEYEIDFSEGNREFTFVNEIIKTIENEAYDFDLNVLKLDVTTQTPLKNAKFGLFDADTDTLLQEAVTSEDGIAHFTNVKYGKYYVAETEAPYGFALNEEKFAVEFDENYDFTADNEPLKIVVEDRALTYNVAIHKTAKDGSKRALEGCEFTLFDKSDDSEVAKVITDENGNATFENIEYKTTGYYAKETATIYGYLLSEEVIDAQVEEGVYDFSTGTVGIDVVNESYQISVKIIKTDGITEVVIPDTEFTVYYKVNDEVAFVGTTDENGELEIKLPYDEYYIKESKAAFGYYADDTVYEITFGDNYQFVNEINEAENIEVTNTSYQFGVSINKMDSKTKEALEGAEFTLYRCVDDEVIATVTSDADGICRFRDINYCTGGFYLIETKAPEGYVKSDKRFVINEESLTKDKEFDFENKPEITFDIPNKLIQLPNTGDNVQLLFGYSTMTLSACGLLSAIRAKKKHTEE